MSAKGLALRHVDYLNTYLLPDQQNLGVAKVSLFRGPGTLQWEHIQEFEWLINQNSVTEYDIHKFLEKHPRFLLGIDYRCLHSQVVLESEDQAMIPDFFAERVGTSFADIIELKKPTEKLVVSKAGRRGFSASLTRALDQVRSYRNFFEDSAHRQKFHDKHGFTAFRPRVMVVIGRSSDYLDYIERIRIEDEYKNLEILTFDDLLARAKAVAIP